MKPSETVVTPDRLMAAAWCWRGHLGYNGLTPWALAHIFNVSVHEIMWTADRLFDSGLRAINGEQVMFSASYCSTIHQPLFYLYSVSAARLNSDFMARCGQYWHKQRRIMDERIREGVVTYDDVFDDTSREYWTGAGYRLSDNTVKLLRSCSKSANGGIDRDRAYGLWHSAREVYEWSTNKELDMEGSLDLRYESPDPDLDDHPDDDHYNDEDND